MTTSVDLIVQAPTKATIEQWLAARGLGTYVQDTDPSSPTFGDFIYTHTDPDTAFLYWRHPDGLMEQTYSEDLTDPDIPVVTITYYPGFWSTLRFYGNDVFVASDTYTWMNTFAAPVSVHGFSGLGGDGVFLPNTSEIQAHLESIARPSHHMQATDFAYTDPSKALFPVMIGDQIEWPEGSGTMFESLIDFNVWTPDQYPQGWQELP